MDRIFLYPTYEAGLGVAHGKSYCQFTRGNVALEKKLLSNKYLLGAHRKQYQVLNVELTWETIMPK